MPQKFLRCSSDGGKTWVWGEVKKRKTGLMTGKD